MRGEVKRVLFECAEGHQWEPEYYSIGGRTTDRGIEWKNGEDVCPKCLPRFPVIGSADGEALRLRRVIEDEIESLEAQHRSTFVHWCQAKALQQDLGAQIARDAQASVRVQLRVLRRILNHLAESEKR